MKAQIITTTFSVPPDLLPSMHLLFNLFFHELPLFLPLCPLLQHHWPPPSSFLKAVSSSPRYLNGLFSHFLQLFVQMLQYYVLNEVAFYPPILSHFPTRHFQSPNLLFCSPPRHLFIYLRILTWGHFFTAFRGRERKGERETLIVASHMGLDPGSSTPRLGIEPAMCPDPELNPQLFCYRMTLQPLEPHWPEWYLLFLYLPFFLH